MVSTLIHTLWYCQIKITRTELFLFIQVVYLIFNLMSKNKKKPAARLTQEQWLEKALELLAREGESKIRIDALVKKLGVTKGSFYWHFKNRNDFLNKLVTYWVDSRTLTAFPEIDAVSGGPEKQLYYLMEWVLVNKGGDYDLAIRALVEHEPELRPIVRKADTLRFEYVRNLFKKIGFRGKELDIRTKLFVVYHSLEMGFYVQNSLAARRRQLKQLHAFFVRK
jgi:AcrR family transcriptional regulator